MIYYKAFKKLVNIFNLAACLFLVFTLITRDYALQETAYFLFFVSYVVEFVTDKKWQNFRLNKTTAYFLVILTFFLLALAYYPFEQSDRYFRFLIEKRYPLLGFSVVGFFGVNSLYKLKYLINTLILTSLTIIIYLVFFKVGINTFIENTNLFNIRREMHINTHMIVNFYLNCSILGIWYLLSNNWKTTHILVKSIFILSVILFIVALSISEGRTGFVLGLFVSITIVFVELWKKKKTLGIIFILIIPWGAGVLISSHQRMSKEVIMSEPRYFLWESGLDVVKESPVLGHGISTAQVKFDAAREIYQTEEYRNHWKESKHLDSHNQYLQTWMELGIVGMLLVIYISFAPLFLIQKKRKNILLLLIILCSSQAFFDMFLTGYFSAIFCIWMIFLLRTPTKEERLLAAEAES